MRVLALETAVAPGSIALLECDRTVACRWLDDHVPTTRQFAAVMRQMLGEVGWRPGDVQLFAVHSGPGSFTGLRIGITAAKTFAYATGCELLSISTLRTIAAGVPHGWKSLWVVMDAQRGELLAARFGCATHGPEPLEAPQVVRPAELKTLLGPEDRLTGPGLTLLDESSLQGLPIVERRFWFPHAGVLGQLACRDFLASRRESYWLLEPTYHRPSAAEEQFRTT